MRVVGWWTLALSISFIDSSSLLSKTINADGTREFRIAKHIKHNTCLCQCRCVPENMDLFARKPVMGAFSTDTKDVDGKAVDEEKNLQTSMRDELATVTVIEKSTVTVSPTVIATSEAEAQKTQRVTSEIPSSESTTSSLTSTDSTTAAAVLSTAETESGTSAPTSTTAVEVQKSKDELQSTTLRDFAAEASTTTTSPTAEPSSETSAAPTTINATTKTTTEALISESLKEIETTFSTLETTSAPMLSTVDFEKIGSTTLALDTTETWPSTESVEDIITLDTSSQLSQTQETEKPPVESFISDGENVQIISDKIPPVKSSTFRPEENFSSTLENATSLTSAISTEEANTAAEVNEAEILSSTTPTSATTYDSKTSEIATTPWQDITEDENKPENKVSLPSVLSVFTSGTPVETAVTEPAFQPPTYGTTESLHPGDLSAVVSVATTFPEIFTSTSTADTATAASTESTSATSSLPAGTSSQVLGEQIEAQTTLPTSLTVDSVAVRKDQAIQKNSIKKSGDNKNIETTLAAISTTAEPTATEVVNDDSTTTQGTTTEGENKLSGISVAVHLEQDSNIFSTSSFVVTPRPGHKDLPERWKGLVLRLKKKLAELKAKKGELAKTLTTATSTQESTSASDSSTQRQTSISIEPSLDATASHSLAEHDHDETTGAAPASTRGATSLAVMPTATILSDTTISTAISPAISESVDDVPMSEHGQNVTDGRDEPHSTSSAVTTASHATESSPMASTSRMGDRDSEGNAYVSTTHALSTQDVEKEAISTTLTFTTPSATIPAAFIDTSDPSDETSTSAQTTTPEEDSFKTAVTDAASSEQISQVETTTALESERHTTPQDVTTITPSFSKVSDERNEVEYTTTTEIPTKVETSTLDKNEKAVGGFVVADGPPSSEEVPENEEQSISQTTSVEMYATASASPSSQKPVSFTIGQPPPERTDFLSSLIKGIIGEVTSTTPTTITSAASLKTPEQTAATDVSHSTSTAATDTSGTDSTLLAETGDFEKRIREERIRFEQAKHYHEEQRRREEQKESDGDRILREELKRRSEEMKRKLEELRAAELKKQSQLEEQQREEQERLREIAEKNERERFAELTSTDAPELQTATQKIRYRLRPSQCAAINKFTRVFKITDPSSWIAKNCQFAKRYFPQASCPQIQSLIESCFALV